MVGMPSRPDLEITSSANPRLKQLVGLRRRRARDEAGVTVVEGYEELGLALVQTGALAVGDDVRTLGSVGGRPFVPGVLVGQVTAVEPQRGRLAPSGTVRPAVDVGTLSVVGVLLSAPRVTPRPAVTGGAT